MTGRVSSADGRQRTAGPRCAAALSAGALALPLLAGCTASDGEAADSPVVQALAGAERDQLRSGGGVTWGIDELPDTLNAFQHEAGPLTDRIAQAVLPHLFTLDGSGTPQANPDYLQSVEVIAEDPKLTVRYQLHPESRWSNGQPLGVEDFVSQWRALSGADRSYWTARNAGYDRIETVVAGDDSGEVVVTFTESYADWKSLFTPLYPQSVTGEPDAFNHGSRDVLPVSAGPFELKTLDRERGRLSLVPNEAWWGDSALLEALVFAEIPREKRLAAMARGDLQVAEVDPSDAARISTASRDRPDAAERDEGASEAAAPDTAGRSGSTGGGDGAAGAAAPGGPPPASEPALLRLAEAQFAGSAAVDATDRAATDRAAAEYAAAVAAEQQERDRAFAAQEQEVSEQLDEYTVHRAYEPSYTQLALNGSSEALADERVRWAVARSLDRTEIAAAVHDPARLPPRPAGSHLWVHGQEEYQDNSAVLGDTGPETAAELLAEAGWHAGPGGGALRRTPEAPESVAESAGDVAASEPGAAAPQQPAVPATAPVRLSAAVPAAQQRAAVLRLTASVAEEVSADGAYHRLAEPADATVRAAEVAEKEAARLARSSATAVRVKQGTPLQLRFLLPDGGPGAEELRIVGDRIVQMLGAAGVDAQIEEVDHERYVSDHIAEGDFDLALWSWPATAWPATDARPVYAKPQPTPGGELFVEQNYSRVGTDHIDQLLDQAGAELDETDRAQLLNDADERIWSAAGSVPLYQSPQLVAADRRLAGVGAFGLETPSFEDIGYRADG